MKVKELVTILTNVKNQEAEIVLSTIPETDTITTSNYTTLAEVLATIDSILVLSAGEKHSNNPTDLVREEVTKWK